MSAYESQLQELLDIYGESKQYDPLYEVNLVRTLQNKVKKLAKIVPPQKKLHVEPISSFTSIGEIVEWGVYVFTNKMLIKSIIVWRSYTHLICIIVVEQFSLIKLLIINVLLLQCEVINLWNCFIRLICIAVHRFLPIMRKLLGTSPSWLLETLTYRFRFFCGGFGGNVMLHHSDRCTDFVCCIVQVTLRFSSGNW